MSSGTRRPLAEAAAIARPLALQLAPVVAHVKFAGSLRRLRPDLGDIELVAELRMVEKPAAPQPDLLAAAAPAEPARVPDVASVRAVIAGWGVEVKGGDRYVQTRLADGTLCDLFLVHPPAQWGPILAIRTGPAVLGELAVTKLRYYGLRLVDGHVEDAYHNVIDTPSEADFFRLARLPFLPPEQRDSPEARRHVEEILLIDMSNFLSRYFHTMREPSLDGLPARVADGLSAVLHRHRPDRVMAFLEGEGEAVRAAALPGYKADRAGREGPSTREMTAVMRPYFSVWGLATREAPGHEADDAIATAAAAAVAKGFRVQVLSGDSDLLQLVDDARGVRVLWPRGGKAGGGEASWGEADVARYFAEHEKFGAPLAPGQIVDLRTIAGGKDGLPRIEIRGEGVKPPYGFSTRRAAELLAAGATLDGLVAGAHAELLRGKEASWLATGGAAAVARREVLRLRTDLDLVSNDGDTRAARLRISALAPGESTAAPDAGPAGTAAAPAAHATIRAPTRCPRCGFVPHPVQDDADVAATIEAGLCPHCGKKVDAAAQLFGEGEDACSECRMKEKRGRRAGEPVPA